MKIDFREQLQKELPAPKEDRDKVKQIAMKAMVGFGIVMIVLTGLSRAADAITTPQVQVDTPKGGRIEQKVEATGTLKPKDEESMETGSGLLVKNVFVEEGDRVKKGDSLVELDAEEIEEKLYTAQNDLKKLQLRLEQLGLNKDFGTTDTPSQKAEKALMKLEQDRLNTIEKEEIKVSRAEEKVRQAETDLKQAEQDLEDFKGGNLEEQLVQAREEEEKAKKYLEDQQYEREKALKRAQQVVDDAKENLWLVAGQGVDATSALQALDRAEMEYDITKSDWERKVKDAETALRKAKEKVKQLENGEMDEAALKQEEEKVKLAKKQVEEQKRLLEDTRTAEQDVLLEMDRKIEEAKNEVLVAKEEEKNLKQDEEQAIQKENIDKQLMQLDIEAKAKEIGRLEKIIVEGGVLKAPSEGIITEVKVEKGATTTGGDLLTFIGDTSEYVLEVEVSNEESEYFEIGDPVEVILEGEKAPLENTVIENITHVTSETGEASGKKKVSVIVPNGTPGMNATFKVTKGSDKYQYIVPIEAVREDNGSKYILVAKKKTTTLGEQIIAERLDVMPLDKNQNSMAIQGALGAQDSIIIKSNKPISSGDRVRLVEQ